MPIILAALVIGALTVVRWGDPIVELEVVALGPDGQFHGTLEMPAGWAEAETTTPDAAVRFPLILGVRNVGHAAARPERLTLQIPARFRLTGPRGEELIALADPATPLLRYDLEPRLGTVEPGLVPTLLPAFETLWLEPVIPRYFCIMLGDAIPEFVPAPPPALGPLSEVRVFYALEGGGLAQRQTGVLVVRLDTTPMAVTMPDPPPSFPMVTDTAEARPALSALRLVGSREVRCGEPESPLEMLSTTWETEGGARMITLDYGGTVRKHLYDLNGDGVIDRESWDPEGDGRFTATRRARLPTPEFLLPVAPVEAYDMARFQGLDPDSLARLDPLARAMREPGPVPLGADAPPPPGAMAPPGTPAAPRPGAPAPVTPAPAEPEPVEEAPAPAPRPAQPLGRPVDEPPPDGERR